MYHATLDSAATAERDDAAGTWGGGALMREASAEAWDGRRTPPQAVKAYARALLSPHRARPAIPAFTITDPSVHDEPVRAAMDSPVPIPDRRLARAVDPA